MAHFAAARPAHELHFTDRERREVVVQHEALVVLAVHVLDLLLVVGRAERAGDKCLRLAAGEDHRAVRAGQHTRLGPDGPDLVELPAIEAHPALEDLVAQHFLFQALEDGLGLGLARGVGLIEGRKELLLHLIHARVVRELVAQPHGLGERRERLLLDIARQLRVDVFHHHLALRLAGILRKRVDRRDDLLDRGVAGLERPGDLLLGHLVRAGFHHHQAVLAARQDDVHQAALPLLVGRVDDVFAVDQADADARNGRVERNLRQRQRRRGAGNRQHVGVVLLVGRENQGDDLRFVPPARREQRPDRPVDHAGGEDFLVRHLAFALEEPAGNAARRVGVLAVVDGQGQEIDVLARAGRATGGDEHHRVAEADEDSPVGLLGQLAGFERKGLRADLQFTRMHKKTR